MKDLFNRTNMMEESKQYGQPRTPMKELLIFFALYFISNIVQSFVLTPSLICVMYGDEKFVALSQAETPDFNAMLTRMTEIMTILPEWVYIITLMSTVLTVVSVMIFCKFIDKSPLSSLGFRKSGAFREYIIGVVIGIVLISLTTAMCLLTGSTEYTGLNNSVSISLALLYLISYLIRGFATVLLFFGYYTTRLTKNLSVTQSILMSSLVYTAFQSMSAVTPSFVLFVSTFVFACFINLYIVKRGNIWGAAAIYGIWGFMQNTVFNFTTQGKSDITHILSFKINLNNSVLNGGYSGMESGLCGLLIMFLALGALYLTKPNKKEIITENNNEINTPD